MTSILAWIAAGWLLVAVVYQALSLLALRRVLRARPGRQAGPRPVCSVLVPSCRVDARTERTLEGLCGLGVPVVCGIEDRARAASMVRRLHARHGEGTLSFRLGPAPAAANRKVANLARMIPAARGEIVVMVDDDIDPPDGYLEGILRPFEDPRVGLVTCAYRAVPGRAVVSRIDALLTNTGYLPSIALASRLEGVRFALGATIAVRRRTLEEIGVVRALGEHVADDWELARLVAEAGLRLELAPVVLRHRVHDDRFPAIRDRQLRLARTIRALRPWGYAGTVLVHGVVPALLLPVAFGAPAAWAIAAWLLVRVGGQALVARDLALSARDLALLPVADLLAFGVFVWSYASREVRWAGRRLRVAPGGVIVRSTPDGTTPPLPVGPQESEEEMVPAGGVEPLS